MNTLPSTCPHGCLYKYKCLFCEQDILNPSGACQCGARVVTPSSYRTDCVACVVDAERKLARAVDMVVSPINDDSDLEVENVKYERKRVNLRPPEKCPRNCFEPIVHIGGAAVIDLTEDEELTQTQVLELEEGAAGPCDSPAYVPVTPPPSSSAAPMCPDAPGPELRKRKVLSPDPFEITHTVASVPILRCPNARCKEMEFEIDHIDAGWNRMKGRCRLCQTQVIVNNNVLQWIHKRRNK